MTITGDTSGALYTNKLREIVDKLTRNESSFQVRSFLDHKDLRQYSATAKEVLTRALATSDMYKRSSTGDGSGARSLTSNDLLPQGVSAYDSFTTQKIWQSEQDVISFARSLANRRPNFANVDASEIVDRVSRETTLNKEQDAALRISTLSGDFTWIAGRAGAGKTHLAGAIKKVTEALEQHLPASQRSVTMGVALTHSVRQNFTSVDFLEEQTATIAKLKLSGASFNRRHVLLVDEAGIVSTSDLLRLMKLAEHGNCKIILIGDEKQFSPIDHGGMFEALQIALPNSGVELATVQRQHDPEHRAAIEAIGRATDQVERRAAFRNFLTVLSQPPEAQNARWPSAVVNHDGLDGALASVEANWLRRLESDPAAQERDRNGPRSVVVASRNVVVQEICNRLHATWHRYEASQGRHRPEFLISTRQPAAEGEPATLVKSKYSPGEGIVFRENKREYKNGSTGLIKDIRPFINPKTKALCGYDFTVQLDYNDKIVIFNTENYNHFEHDTAITLYRSQGRTYDNVQAVVDGKLGAERGLVEGSRHRISLTLHVTEPDLHDLDAFAEKLSVSHGKRAAITASLHQEREREDRHNRMDIDAVESHSNIRSFVPRSWQSMDVDDPAFDHEHGLPGNDVGSAAMRQDGAAGTIGARVPEAPVTSRLAMNAHEVGSNSGTSFFSPSVLEALDQLDGGSKGAASTTSARSHEQAEDRVVRWLAGVAANDRMNVDNPAFSHEHALPGNDVSSAAMRPDRAADTMGARVPETPLTSRPAMNVHEAGSDSGASLFSPSVLETLDQMGGGAKGTASVTPARLHGQGNGGHIDDGASTDSPSGINHPLVGRLSRLIRPSAESVEAATASIRASAGWSGVSPVTPSAKQTLARPEASRKRRDRSMADEAGDERPPRKRQRFEIQSDAAGTLVRALLKGDMQTVMNLVETVRCEPDRSRMDLLQAKDEWNVPALARALRNGNSRESVKTFFAAIHSMSDEELSSKQKIILIEAKDASGVTGITHALESGDPAMVLVYGKALEPLPEKDQLRLIEGRDGENVPALVRALKMGRSAPLERYRLAIARFPPDKQLGLLAANDGSGSSALSHALASGNAEVVRAHMHALRSLPAEVVASEQGIRLLEANFRESPAFVNALRVGHTDAAVAYCEGLISMLPPTRYIPLIEARSHDGKPVLAQALEQGQGNVLRSFEKIIPLIPDNLQRHLLEARTFTPGTVSGSTSKQGNSLQGNFQATSGLLGVPGLSHAIEQGHSDAVVLYAALLKHRPLAEQKAILRATENGGISGLNRAERDGMERVKYLRSNLSQTKADWERMDENEATRLSREMLKDTFIPEAKKAALYQIRDVSAREFDERRSAHGR